MLARTTCLLPMKSATGNRLLFKRRVRNTSLKLKINKYINITFAIIKKSTLVLTLSLTLCYSLYQLAAICRHSRYYAHQPHCK